MTQLTHKGVISRIDKIDDNH